MHILIDLQGAQTSGSRTRGIGRYSRALTEAMLRNRASHRITLLLNGNFPAEIDAVKAEFSEHLSPDDIFVFSTPTAVGGAWPTNNFRREAAELIREWAVLNIAPDVTLMTSVFEGATDLAVTSIGRWPGGPANAAILYDLIPLQHPGALIPSTDHSQWYHSKIDAVRAANLVLCISEHTRSDAIRLLDLNPDSVTSISSAADGRFRKSEQNAAILRPLLTRLGIRRKFFLHAGAFEPRKNFEGLLRAFGLLPKAVRRQRQLVFASAVGWQSETELDRLARRSGLGPDDLVITGRLSDDELVALYGACELFVFPSFNEGFGLPALEAMRCGAVAIGSDASSIPEVIGDPEALFDPKSPADMSKVMLRAVTEHSFRARLAERQARHVQRFSWDLTARHALTALTGLPAPAPLSDGATVASLLGAIAALASLDQATRGDLFALAVHIAETEQELEAWRLDHADRPTPPTQALAETGAVVPVQARAREPASSKRPLEVQVLRRNPQLLSSSPSILVLKLDHIGDFILTIEAFEILRKSWPQANITLICGPWNKALAERTGLFDRVISCRVFSGAGSDYDPDEIKGTGLDNYQALQLGEFDLAIDMRYQPDGRFLLSHTNANIRAGFAAPDVELDLSFPTSPEMSSMFHAGARGVALASAVAWTFGRHIGARERLLCGRPAQRCFNEGTIVGLAPGAGSSIKAWGSNQFAELAELLLQEGDYRFLLIGGPGDRDDAALIAARMPPDRYLDLAGQIAIDDLAPLIAGLDAFVGNDTGTTHLAAELGVPTVAVFSGQSHIHTWRPIGAAVTALTGRVHCSPCYLAKLESCTQDHRCMNISARQVADEVTAILGRAITSDWNTGSADESVGAARSQTAARTDRA